MEQTCYRLVNCEAADVLQTLEVLLAGDAVNFFR